MEGNPARQDSSSTHAPSLDIDTSSIDLSKWIKRRFQVPSDYKSCKFDRYVGINTEVDLSSPLNVFSLFVTSTFLQLIVTESNRYALQCHQNLNLTIKELKVFIALLIIVGFHSLPSMRLYWSKDMNFHVSRISNSMRMHRFLKIWKKSKFNIFRLLSFVLFNFSTINYL